MINREQFNAARKDFWRGCKLWAFSTLISVFAFYAWIFYGRGIHNCGWNEVGNLCVSGLFTVTVLVFLFIQGHDRT